MSRCDYSLPACRPAGFQPAHLSYTALLRAQNPPAWTSSSQASLFSLVYFIIPKPDQQATHVEALATSWWKKGQQASCLVPALSYGWGWSTGWAGSAGQQTRAWKLVSSEQGAMYSPALGLFILYKIYILQRAPAIPSLQKAVDIHTKRSLFVQLLFYFSHLLCSLNFHPRPTSLRFGRNRGAELVFILGLRTLSTDRCFSCS